MNRNLETIIGIGLPIAAGVSRIILPNEVAAILGSHEARAAMEHVFEAASVLYWMPIILRPAMKHYAKILYTVKKAFNKAEAYYKMAEDLVNNKLLIAAIYISGVALHEGIQVFSSIFKNGKPHYQPEQYIASLVGIGFGLAIYNHKFKT